MPAGATASAAIDARDRAGRRPPRADPDRRDPARAGAGRRRGRRQQHPRRDRGAAAPSTRTRRPARCGTGCASWLGVDVGVVVTDTFGRPWRNGPDRPAIGVAGLRAAATTARPRRRPRQRARASTVTAVADEVAAAADLVKGKPPACRSPWSAGWPRSPGRRTTARARRGAGARRPPRTCSGSAPARPCVTLAAHRPRVHRRAGRPAARPARRRRRGHRAGAAPHDAVAVRARRGRRDAQRLLDAMVDAWARRPAAATGSPTSRSTERVRRGDVLRARAVPRRAVPGRRRRARLPRRAAGRGRARDVRRRDRRRACRTCWSRWPSRGSGRRGCRSTMFCRDVVREVARPARRTGTRWARSRSAAPPMPVTERPIPDAEPYVLVR